ncbi:MAG: hypothetical protein NC299_01205 [Lachnospiraceae bacterium]|nr:hypothetical protein [Lachnospiraceae bacterium]
MYNITPVSLFFSAVFAVLYLGTDNSDRTVRNRLIAGVPRVKVYFAGLITVSVGTALIFAAAWLAVIIYDLACGVGLGIAAAATAVGALIFRKKDIK